MKVFYCVFAILTAFTCGVFIAKEIWFSAIINLLCAFSNATWFIIECNKNRMDNDIEN